ncbi:sugar phosphate isomerase/epimerase family protein [Halogeometricum luteum]|uniref:Sugar phosphate isomerase/epimerase n=1 Tax=Halogeometricum luteum TaxID=2950537 RepID=A0ABU2G1J6_9EURY|nr:sugar phosphate isomerase/epimerase [Halogeometricum sp. S3BR5-2]MDS0294163.1 sugar phosphate isomerase/epimerase [Halogeometricum sp. S3BR5-2]
MSTEYAVGVQTVVFQHRTLEELLSDLAETGIDTIDLWDGHLSADDDEETVAAAEEALEAAGVSVCGCGVVDIEGPEEVREHVAFADRLGASYLAVNYPPDRDDVTEALVAAAEEFGVDVAIHNYSSVHHDDLSTVFSSIDDVRAVLDRYDDPRLGVCVDTGHFLVEDVDPADVIRELGDRIVAVHLKDTSEAEIEDLPGAGRLDLSTLVALLDDHAHLTAPLVIEYELPEDRAVEALREAEANVRAAMR